MGSVTVNQLHFGVTCVHNCQDISWSHWPSKGLSILASRYFLIPLTKSRMFDPCVKIFLYPTDQVKDFRSLCQGISWSHWPSQGFSILASRYFLIPLTKSRIFDPWSRYFLIPLTQSRIIDPCVKIFLDPTDQVKYFSIQFYLLFFSSIYYFSVLFIIFQFYLLLFSQYFFYTFPIKIVTAIILMKGNINSISCSIWRASSSHIFQKVFFYYPKRLW